MPPKFGIRNLLFVLVLSALAYSQDKPQPWDSVAFGATPQDVLTAADKIPTSKTDDSIVLLQEDHFTFDAQGKSVHTHRIVGKILTAGGVDQWKSLSAEYEPWHEQKPLLQAHVITPDGLVHSLDTKTIADDTAQSEDDDIYTDNRVVRAPLPALAAGVVFEEQTTYTETAPLFEAGSVHSVYFGYHIPVLQSRLIIDTPSSVAIQHEHKLLPQLVVHSSEDQGRTITTFVNGRIDPVDEAEVDLPSDVAAWPHITFSLAKSWQQVAAAYSKMVDEKIAGADVKSFVDAATRTEKDRVKIADSLVAQLHKEVRYTGIEFGQSSLVPHPPAETLKHKFGDCKDKAALLVSMFRAAGMPAYLALLSTGPGEDVPQNLAGMGHFDHAIVFVPGTPDLWIDATAEYMTVGQLPSADQGRLALIVRPETTALQLTPELPSSADRTIETREFFLPEDGGSRIVETTEYDGLSASSMRHDYSNAISKDFRKNLDDYMKNTYLAEKLDKMDHSTPSDLSKPFTLRLESTKAKRGNVDENEAVVAVPLSNIFRRLPDFMLSDVEPDDPAKKVPEGESKYKPRKNDMVLAYSFINEWHYKITPPPEFVLRSLPKNQSDSFGPAQLTREFSKDPDGTVEATFRFDTVKKHWTAAEVESARKSIREFYKKDMDLIYFDNRGQVALQAGKVKDALAIYSGLATLHPKEAIHHTQLANAYLVAGLGDEARQEAQLAVKLDPTSARAYKTLGWVLQHDLIGRQLQKGFDLTGSVAAYRKAKQLDPDDTYIASSLAILLEYNPDGDRYGPGSDLEGAITEYEALSKKLDKNDRLIDNPLWSMAHAGEFKKIKEKTAALSSTPTRVGFSVLASGMLDGVDAALKEATRLTGDNTARSAALVAAGDQAIRIRAYKLAADLFTAGAEGQPEAASYLGRAELLRKTNRFDQMLLPDSDPRSACQRFYLASFHGETGDKLLSWLSKYDFLEKNKQDFVDRMNRTSRQTRHSMLQTGLSIDVLSDIALSNMQYSVEGDDNLGYRIRIQSIGAPPQTHYVIKEAGAYKIIDLDAMGPYLQKRFDDKDLDAVHHWLDLIREELKRPGGEDRFAGRPFGLFWTKGQAMDVDAARLAVAVLSTQSEYAESAIPVLLDARDKAASDSARLDLDFALADAYQKSERYSDLLPVAQRMYAAEPTSVAAFDMVINSLNRLSRFDEANQAAQDRLKKLPDDLDAIRALARIGLESNHPEATRTWEHKIVELGKANVEDFNLEAWSALFQGKADDDAVSEARRGLALGQNREPAIMHTLASIYAEQGKTSEARELILKVLDLWQLDEPNSEAWFVFGRIAEQYGKNDAAMRCYSRVDKKDYKILTGGSTYVLVQKRIAALGTGAVVASNTAQK